ncbi:hypothetical protein [Planktotalea sp.]
MPLTGTAAVRAISPKSDAPQAEPMDRRITNVIGPFLLAPGAYGYYG